MSHEGVPIIHHAGTEYPQSAQPVQTEVPRATGHPVTEFFPQPEEARLDGEESAKTWEEITNDWARLIRERELAEDPISF